MNPNGAGRTRFFIITALAALMLSTTGVTGCASLPMGAPGVAATAGTAGARNGPSASAIDTASADRAVIRLVVENQTNGTGSVILTNAGRRVVFDETVPGYSTRVIVVPLRIMSEPLLASVRILGDRDRVRDAEPVLPADGLMLSIRSSALVWGTAPVRYLGLRSSGAGQ